MILLAIILSIVFSNNKFLAAASTGTTPVVDTSRPNVAAPDSDTLDGTGIIGDSSRIDENKNSVRSRSESIVTEEEDHSDADTFFGSLRPVSRNLHRLESDSEGHETNYIAECNLPSILGDFKMRAYTYREAGETQNKLEPVVVVMGDVQDQEDVMVRVHDQCFTSEVFGSKRCDCRQQLEESLKMIKENFRTTGKGGILIYLQQEGRGIGLPNKIAAYSLQDQGMDTVDANTHLGFADEMREYVAVPDILDDMGVKSVRLITNNPYKVDQLKKLGVKITDRISVELDSNEHNIAYLRTKKMRMNHVLKNTKLRARDKADITTITTTEEEEEKKKKKKRGKK